MLIRIKSGRPLYYIVDGRPKGEYLIRLYSAWSADDLVHSQIIDTRYNRICVAVDNDHKRIVLLNKFDVCKKKKKKISSLVI